MHYTLFLEMKCRARRIGGVGGQISAGAWKSGLWTTGERRFVNMPSMPSMGAT